MLKVLKNLKNSWISVICIIILLCIQAAADLALPDYTSKIVNDGIQSGGIESAVPEVISKQDMNSILIFSEDDEEILNSYELVTDGVSKDQEKTLKKYFGKDYSVEPDSIYVLKNLEEEQLDNLEGYIVNPILELETISNEETSEQIKNKILENIAEPKKHICKDYL